MANRISPATYGTMYPRSRIFNLSGDLSVPKDTRKSQREIWPQLWPVLLGHHHKISRFHPVRCYSGAYYCMLPQKAALRIWRRPYYFFKNLAMDADLQCYRTCA